MMHGRNNGKKIMAVRIIKHTMEIIHLLTDSNPIQIIVDAIINRYCTACVSCLFAIILGDVKSSGTHLY
jgi:small subunit ribosomal protein S5e